MARGDHIFVSSTVRGIPFQHHGIDMGDGTVIHLAPASGARMTLRDDSGEFCVRRDSYEKFCLGCVPSKMEHFDARQPDDVVAAAEASLGKAGYSLLDGNCEHFATLCATGRSESHQIEMGEATVSAMASMATKAFWSASGRLAGRIAVRGSMRVHPAALLADGVEIATLAVGCRSGLSAQRSRRLARASGSVAAAGIGGILGGPAGAALGLAAHHSSSAVAESICKSVRRILS